MAGLLMPALRVAVIIVLALILQRIASTAIIRIRERLTSMMTDDERLRRMATLSRVVRYMVSVVIGLITVILVLSELGISVAPILGAAGVVGLAIGFGAQSLVKDYFTGFFLLLEDQLRRGDVVQLAGYGGVVEDLTLRYVRLRDYEGLVHFIPNGLISVVSNLGREYAYALMDIGVAYREDLTQVYQVIEACAARFRESPPYREAIIEPLEIAGVERWADSAVIIRCRFKVRPLQQWFIRRAFLRELKQEFDGVGIEIPYPHLTVYAGDPKPATAACIASPPPSSEQRIAP